MVEDRLSGWLVPHIIPQYCYVHFFVNLNFLHGECLRILLSKCLGFGIILGAAIVKLPQVIKILRAGSARGVSASSNLLELAGVSATLAYSIRNRFPFSSYGEASFLILQTALIVFLILYYSPERGVGQALLFALLYSLIIATLCAPFTPTVLITALQACNIPLVVGGKCIQAYQNHSSGSTGQLSALTVFLLTAGSLARIFTSWQETGDAMMVLTYTLASSVNLLLSAQILHYWNSSTPPTPTPTPTPDHRKPAEKRQ